jgi:thymidylate kinase
LRVHAALSGESDLDLLIAREDQHRAQAILLEQGFKLFRDVANRDHPAVSSYLGYDEPSGRIVHLHLHFRLVVGEKLLKNYRLPYEAVILSRAVLHPTLPIRVLDPANEALLLVARAALESRLMDPVALRHWAATKQKFELDRAALAARLDRITLRNRASEAFTNDLADMVVDAVFCGRPYKHQADRRRRIRRELAAHRAYNAVEARVRSWTRAVLWAAGGFNKRIFHVPRPWSRRTPGGGCVAAVIGVDGSGKTTVVAAIQTWLGSEVDVMPVYFGTGDGRPSLLLLPFKMMVPVITRLFRTKPRGASHGRISDRAPGPLYSLLMMVWAAAVAGEKRIKLRAAHRGARRGLVVVADRYPQNEDIGYSDGPLLPRLTRAPRWLRRFEERAYALAHRLPPDLVLKLEVTPETAARREQDMDPAVIRQRIEGARRLAFPGARVIRVDAEQPLECVIRSVKREIWGLL